MKTIIFSDLHGNLPALECLMKLYPKDNKWISLGDNVNYGPWSNECVQILKNELNCICVKGNHEKYFLNGDIAVRRQVILASESAATHNTINQTPEGCYDFFIERFSWRCAGSKPVGA